MRTGHSTLFVPHLPEEYAIWMGRLHTLQDFKDKYEVDEVVYADEVCIFSNPALADRVGKFLFTLMSIAAHLN